MPSAEALASMAHEFHARGWMAGTAGNLSVRSAADAPDFWITASGVAKGHMTPQDTVRIATAAGHVLEAGSATAKPSAETTIHQAIYRLFPSVRACLHVHTVDACRVSTMATISATTLPLPPLEMIKGLGVWEETPQVAIALFDNWLEVPRIAAAILERFTATPPEVPGLLIRHHGVTAWGESLQQAYNRLEIFEFLFSYLARGK